jgi:hypothetical protein
MLAMRELLSIGLESMIGGWKDGRRIAKESGKFNPQVKSQAGLPPSVYDTVRFK